jgi:hypothetical protein
VRNVIVLLALAAVLVVLTHLSDLAADWHYVVSAAPGQVLYTATFDDMLADWEQYEGRLSAQVENSALRIAVNAPDSLPFSTASPHFSDFDLRVLARPVAGPIDNGYGIIFRARDLLNYYLFLVSSDGYYQVLRAVNGEQKEISTWIPSALIRQGLNAENWLRVVAQGNSFQFYINDEPVELCIPDDPAGVSTYVNECIGGQMLPLLVDNSIADGRIGVIARTFDEPGVVVEFDNVLVVGPASGDG